MEDRHGYREPPDLDRWLKQQYPEDARLELQVFRGGAFYYFIEAAALRVEGREEMPGVRRLLQRLGGMLARLKHRPDREAERRTLSEKLAYQQTYLRVLPRWPKAEGAQFWWHWTIVQASTQLRGHGASGRVSSEEIQRLCHWLSIPKIGLHCTSAVIKAARRRVVTRSWFGQACPTYISTPRGRAHVPPAPNGDEGEDACVNADDRIIMSCRRCDAIQPGTLYDIGSHLQQEHGLTSDMIEVSESTRQDMCLKETGEVVLSWRKAGIED